MPLDPRPSLFDIQVNGFAGVDFQNPNLTVAELRWACLSLRRHRTHRILLTLITDSITALKRQFARIESFRSGDPLVRETIAGYHLEGPYISPVDGFRGAHPREFVKGPDLREFDLLQAAAGGLIRIITVAPEWPGCARFIAGLVNRGVVVSLGHTDASEREIDRAVMAGARLCTHLGNGCPTTLHRHDNIMQRLLTRDELIASFIPDGIHILPEVLKNLLRAKPLRKIILTTDAMAAAAAPPGNYQFGKLRLKCGRDRVVRMPGAMTFAGSSLTLDQGVANAARWSGTAPRTAWDWASSIPAAVFGLRLPRA
jgi:N-acetylglucosamine-6-phosphate deacetylase